MSFDAFHMPGKIRSSVAPHAPLGAMFRGKFWLTTATTIPIQNTKANQCGQNAEMFDLFIINIYAWSQRPRTGRGTNIKIYLAGYLTHSI